MCVTLFPFVPIRGGGTLGDKGDNGDGVPLIPLSKLMGGTVLTIHRKGTVSPLSPSVPLHWGTEGDKGDTLYPSILYHDYEQEGGGDKGDKGSPSPFTGGHRGIRGTSSTSHSSIMIM